MKIQIYAGLTDKKKRQIPKNLSHRAQDETRTHTILRPLPPQSSVDTNFTTCASRSANVASGCRHAALSATLPPLFKKQNNRFSSQAISIIFFFEKAAFRLPLYSTQCAHYVEVYKDHFVVPRTGLEPARLSTYAPETYASTNSATWAERSANRAIGCRLRDIRRTIASAPSKNNFASSFSRVTKIIFQ